MLNAAETSPAAAAAAGVNTGNHNEEVDPDVFARELEASMSAKNRVQDSIAQTMERLAAAFPGLTVTGRNMSGFGEVTEYYARTGADSSLNLSPDILAQMGEDEELFNRVKDMVSGLFAAGAKQNLVNVGGQNVHRNVSVDGETVRYVEVQRSASGTQLSASTLSLQNEEMVNETLLDYLTAARQQSQSSSASGKGGTRNSSSSSAARGFQGMLNLSSGWRMESFVSAQSLDRFLGVQANASMQFSGSLSARNMFDQQMLMTSQSITANLEVIIEQWQGAGGSVDLWSYMQVAGLSDPLVLDLGDEGINLRGPEDGVYFDIKGDGTPVRTAFIQSNNAFLYLDENGNGVADDANELFGDHGGFKNGFEKLAQYDDNGDGVIDERDAVYHDLRLWRDLNGDGINQKSESMSLAEAGVKSINLRHDNHQALDAHGNVIGERSSFTRTDGSRGLIADVWLRNL